MRDSAKDSGIREPSAGNCTYAAADICPPEIAQTREASVEVLAVRESGRAALLPGMKEYGAILKVGASAWGARAKAIIGLNKSTGEVWGVGRRLAVKLRAEQIFTAKDLRDAPDDVIRSVGGVVLLRTATELRGTPCNEERDYEADPDSVSCSRSFGEPVTTLDGLAESLASFTAQAATKLRRHGLLAAGCNVYAQIFRSGGGGDFIGRTVMFPVPTDATNVMLKAISEEVEALFIPGTRYRKTGVVFFGLEKVGTARQMDLFAPVEKSEASPLYRAIDSLNKRYGKGRIISAAEGLGERSWKMKRDKLSKRPTTRWDELMTVR